MKKTMNPILAGCALAACSLTPMASADVILDWNEQLLNAIRTSSMNPPKATRQMAMVHCAMFDAVNGLTDLFRPYSMTDTPPAGASPEAAAAKAAHHVLSHLYPQYQAAFDSALALSLNAIPDGSSKDDGVAWGETCAAAIITLRSGDNSDVVVPYTPGVGPGWWIPTPPAYAPALLPNWPIVTPWTMTSGDQFRVNLIPALDSAEYAAAHDQVRLLGGVGSKHRTADESEIAVFWVDGPGTATPPGHWLVIASQLSQQFGLSLHENARLFAMLSLGAADAAIVSWDMKYAYNHWRPVTAIRAADGDGNRDTTQDKTWSSFVGTPPFPAYTSGHSTFSRTSAELLARYFGTNDIAFSTQSDGLPGVTRDFNSFTHASDEAGWSRIYGGIHWIYDHAGSVASAAPLAAHIWDTQLRRLGDLTGDDRVNMDDVMAFIPLWGSDDADADLDGDGSVGFMDLMNLLARWKD